VSDYTLTRSKRKTLALYIKPDGSVEVRAPLRLAKRDIERFVASKRRSNGLA
jgi:predicted metal-dependent hydrolase